jgi:protein-tyrosine phosphatase
MKADLERVVKVTADHARSGRNIVIHCYAGIGRTGLLASYLAKEILGLSGLEAIRWVRKYIPGAVEAPEQRQLILEDDPNYRPPENHKD